MLNDFEDILLLANLPKKLGAMRKTRFSIQFQYGGFDVDLLPAMDFVTTPTKDPASEQAFFVLQRICEHKDKAYYYSSALAETQLAFMRKQSPFIHDLVRLCKLWNKSLLIDDYISGRSTLIELVAVYAGKKEENRTCFQEKQSILSAFDTFLALMQNFGQIKVEFHDFDPLQPQRSIDHYPDFKSNDHLKRTTPFVIEPANPFNNLAKGVKPSQMKLFEMFAAETRRRLNLYVIIKSVAHIPLDQVFEPQPTIFVYMSDLMKKFISNLQFMVSSKVNDGPSSPTMTIRKEEKYKSVEMQMVLKHFQSVFSIVAQGFISSKNWDQKLTADESSHELQIKIQELIDINILGLSNTRTWSSATNRHEDQDITFSIPNYLVVNGKEEKVCVLISLTAK